jgi:hypothetical protein
MGYNGLNLRFKKHSVIAVYRNNRCFLWDPNKNIITMCGQNLEYLKVKLVVHVVKTGLQSFKSQL